MAIQKFALGAIQKVRNVIQAELSVADTQAQFPIGMGFSAEIPEPESIDDLSNIFTFGGQSAAEQNNLILNSQWFVSTFNPASVLRRLPGLRLKPNYRLVSYLYRAAPDGAGLIFALPEALSTTAHLQKALDHSTIANPPRPEGAVPLMAAIDGDRSAASFIVASLLRRELQEFGALGKRRTWSHHRLIQALPVQLAWQWRSDIPKDWLPKAIVMPDKQAAVEFFSCRIGLQDVVLYRHLDRYPAIGYQATSLDQAVAVARRG